MSRTSRFGAAPYLLYLVLRPDPRALHTSVAAPASLEGRCERTRCFCSLETGRGRRVEGLQHPRTGYSKTRVADLR